MKTLIKRPNYTLSIKTSCYSAFSFYTFFRNDRISALLSCLIDRLTNQPPELPDRSFLFCLVDRCTNNFTVLLHWPTALIASLTALTSALYIGESEPHFCLIYRRRPN